MGGRAAIQVEKAERELAIKEQIYIIKPKERKAIYFSLRPTELYGSPPVPNLTGCCHKGGRRAGAATGPPCTEGGGQIGCCMVLGAHSHLLTAPPMGADTLLMGRACGGSDMTAPTARPR